MWTSPAHLSAGHQHNIGSWSSHLPSVATRTCKVNGEIFLALNDAALDFTSPPSPPEITFRLS